MVARTEWSKMQPISPFLETLLRSFFVENV